MWTLLFILSHLLPQQSLSVDVRENEVWLTRNGVDTQLTHDKKAKLQAELAPAKDRIAYYEECPQSENCTPSIVILALDGQRITSFHVISPQSPNPTPCMSILSIAWLNQFEIAAECHINPSLGEFIVSDIHAKRVTKDLFGFAFAPSPDGNSIAHVGWIPHFAPPFAKSEYLQIDDTLIYPLSTGKSPVILKSLEGPSDVVHNEGDNYIGIHECGSGFHWSADGRHIAFVDCVFDWKATSPDGHVGDEVNRTCSLIAISRDGKFQSFPLGEMSKGDLYQAKISWNGLHEITIGAGAVKKTFQVN
jgi:hypothetical protein